MTRSQQFLVQIRAAFTQGKVGIGPGLGKGFGRQVGHGHVGFDFPGMGLRQQGAIRSEDQRSTGMVGLAAVLGTIELHRSRRSGLIGDHGENSVLDGAEAVESELVLGPAGNRLLGVLGPGTAAAGAGHQEDFSPFEGQDAGDLGVHGVVTDDDADLALPHVVHGQGAPPHVHQTLVLGHVDLAGLSQVAVGTDQDLAVENQILLLFRHAHRQHHPELARNLLQAPDAGASRNRLGGRPALLRHPVAVDGQLREKGQLHTLLGGFAGPPFHLLQIPLGLPQVPIHLNSGHSDGLQGVLLPDAG